MGKVHSMDLIDRNDFIYDLIVVGGGAAGYFGAICAAESNPGLRVAILEKSSKVLSKVRISGGGRCNVTHHCFNPFQLADHYPRGEKTLKSLFKSFQASDMVNWLEQRGVQLKTEEDGRMFPETDSSLTIIDCFVKECARLGIETKLNSAVARLKHEPGHLLLECEGGKTFSSRNVLVCTGGHPSSSSYDWLRDLGHRIVEPVPSLFTFNDRQRVFSDLMGISVPNASVRIAGTKFVQQGPVLITHWGLSGPAVIKLSAWAAVYLAERKYRFTVHVNWSGLNQEDEVRQLLLSLKNDHPKQRVSSQAPVRIPVRLWTKLCAHAEVPDMKVWGELSAKHLNRLLEYLFRYPLNIEGKTTFKEEFVTCGGIDLSEVSMQTMESKKCRNLFFAGEVLNIDGETGGFNFQAAWTTAFIAARAIANAPAG